MDNLTMDIVNQRNYYQESKQVEIHLELSMT